MKRPSGFIALLLLSVLLSTLPTREAALAAGPLTVVAVGDIMMGTDWPEDLLPPRDGAGMFDNVLESLRGADIVFGNLEGALADGGEGVKCDRKRRAKGGKTLCFEFRTPTRYVGHLASAGFRTMNIANNHTFDFGLEGVKSTIAALEEAGIQAAGGDNVAAFCIRGKTVAVVGFSYSPPSPHSHPLQDLPSAMEIVGGLKEDFDLVIVSFHGGAEGKDALRVPDADEVFAGENRGNVVRFARAVIDAGADLVIGHGPHVPRAMEVYQGKLIAYSLGNFLTYGRFNLQGPSGVSYVLRAEIDLETGNFSSGAIVPMELLDRGIPFLDQEKKAVKIIRELTAERQVEPGLVIGEDGVLTPVAPPQPSSTGQSFPSNRD
jgi:poly-gamma-glutamate capsule biosynthesis protein CapA/YwtB (metallophosphatase superfamily)